MATDNVSVLINEIQGLLEGFENTSSSLHTMSPAELFACQRKWANLVKVTKSRVTDVCTATEKEFAFLRGRISDGEKLPLFNDINISTHLRWNFDLLVSAARSIGAKRGCVALEFADSLHIVSSFTTLTEDNVSANLPPDLREIFTSSMTTSLVANVKNMRSKGSFQTAVVAPIIIKGDCVGVVGLMDNIGPHPFSHANEGAASVVASMIADYISRHNLVSSFRKIYKNIPLAPFQEEYFRNVQGKVSDFDCQRPQFSVRIHRQPKTRPQWNEQVQAFVRYPTDIPSLIKDIQSQLDEAVGLQKLCEDRLTASLAAESLANDKYEKTLKLLDIATKDLALIRLANQRLLSKSFLEPKIAPHNETASAAPPQFSGSVPRSPRWNSAARLNRAK